MNRKTTLAWLNDLLYDADGHLNPLCIAAIKTAIKTIETPVKVEIWSDSEQRVSASPLIKVKIHNYSRYGRCDI